ncbi:Cytosol aminopeptidase [Mycoplasmopsis californica]|uniref:Probable cytosol aminopeptidase n=1 Tax=Mycoplasmopsis equigenitalium TaxID=114883 RepID=A0ABY5J1T6_9BACT|nr:leucyl aminopeptidase family protein [Mycoplasmopsis equigenitalium]UUD37214.1 leucyl aminopeptidase family protein [Mycoplasmopsis equigenitalium]VEU69482.1 Cytosol aminopeptidase [Mycoplasmopsis californica]
MYIKKSVENNNLVLRTITKDAKQNKIVKENNYLNDFLSENVSYVYIENAKKYSAKDFKELVTKLVANKRSCVIDAKSFIFENLKIHEIIKTFLDTYIFEKHILWNEKTTVKNKEFTVELLLSEEDTNKFSDLINKTLIVAEQVNMARDLQIMPPNICNSEFLASYIENKAKEIKNPNLSVKVLGKEEITKLGMNLLLAVNRGSKYEPRVVILEYTGDKNNSDKTVYVGKGITFDSGGYNLKTGGYILGMKYDMSGSVIVASAMLGIAKLNTKKNISCVMVITDNRIDGDANLPDAVWKSMNGKTVEINNTDAEGRLVLADGITYAIRELKATKILDIATLTGAIKVALGQTFTGMWATESKFAIEFKKAAKDANELIWQMPYHEDFAKDIKTSKVADLKNSSTTGMGGSISAFMFLNEFNEKLPHIHLDIAGTAKSAEEPVGVMVKTLIELGINQG